jgi:hypothetical protein
MTVSPTGTQCTASWRGVGVASGSSSPERASTTSSPRKSAVVTAMVPM